MKIGLVKNPSEPSLRLKKIRYRIVVVKFRNNKILRKLIDFIIRKSEFKNFDNSLHSVDKQGNQEVKSKYKLRGGQALTDSASPPIIKVSSKIQFLSPIFLYGLTARALGLVIKNIDKNIKYKISNLPVDRL